MIENLKPLYDRVVVQRIEKEQKTDGGLYIPNQSQEASQWGKVIATGSGRLTASGELKPLAVNVGDIVFLVKYPNNQSSDNEYLIVKEDEILGVVSSELFN